MATNNLNTISSSKKEIYDKLLKIAENYTDTDADYLKTGLFGYITEGLASMMRDTTIHKSMLYNESFLTTAVMPKSIYSWAKMFNIDITNATPSYADIDIIIPQESITLIQAYDKSYFGSDILNSNGDIISSVILDKRDPIIAGDYYFALEHSIMIYQNYNKDNTSNLYTAKYISTEPNTTNYQKLSSYFLPIITDGTNIIIKARAYQYEVTEFSRQISSSTYLNKVQRYSFSDQFAGARLFYSIFNSDEEEVQLVYSNLLNQVDGVKYAYYSLLDNNEFEVKFKSGENGFIPATNSTLKLQLFTTKGSNIPNNFNGDAFIQISNENLRSLPIVINFNPTNILGGSDVPSLEKIKQTVINEISTRNTIITESDLNSYFELLTGLLESVNDGKVKFIKRRDDILKRIFSAYILMRDGLNDDDTDYITAGYESKCVPTNTINGIFPINKNKSLEFPKIKYNIEDNKYYYINDIVAASDDDYYVCPFYLYTTLQPFKKVKYLYNLTNETSSLSYNESSSSPKLYIIPVSVQLLRMIEGNKPQDYYTAKFLFNTNFDINSNIYSSSNILDLRLVSPKTNQFLGSIQIGSDKVNLNSELQSDGVYLTSFECRIDVAENEFEFVNNTTDYGTNIYLKNGNNTIPLPEEIKLNLKMDNIQIGNETFSAAFQSDDSVHLFRNLDDIMLSDITMISNKTTTNKDDAVYVAFEISDIPVVHSSFFTQDSEDRKDSFIKQLFTYIDMLKENLTKLETSTFFDLKFYNTYGPSKLYNTSRTNLDLELDIYLKQEFENNENLKKEIISYVRRAVDKSNDSKKLRISSIISLIQQTDTYGNYIDHIDFRGLNGTFNQFIKRNNEDEIYYAPEWLNLSAGSLAHICFLKLEE